LQMRANLKGAKYTLAVPSYVAATGVRNFSDLHANAERFKHRVIGIEPGNNGNRMIGTPIADNRFGLGDWTLVESSEQGMLSEVDRAIRRSDWIVFLAWSPHPMNLKYHIEYLAGGDDTFGASYGGATIYTDVRSGYVAECPNVGALLSNLEFTPGIERQLIRRSLRSAGIGDCLADRRPLANPGIIAHRRFGGSRRSPSAFTGARSVHSGRDAAHRQPGLLGAIDPDPRAGLVFNLGVRACRDSHRHHRRAPAVGLPIPASHHLGPSLQTITRQYGVDPTVVSPGAIWFQCFEAPAVKRLCDEFPLCAAAIGVDVLG
jgi:hypothetical protein